uniref:NADPH oxidase organizer 1b n=1 Tax=Gasterosteus aculeatus aculeatus TaxID=481459 RepID=G3P3M6_GASAC|nr:NADPH oxidase organizer 1-like isoform X1 [Gasterosteus aculeatus aculeatus]
MSGERRFVFSARVIGAVHRDSPKLRVFMISVLWSDKAEVIVYRSFSDFKKLHKQLKKRFQPVNTLKKNERVIPKFRGQARRNSLQQKASQRCVQRMKFLETYCHKLLKCDHAVTQSSEATHFFLPNDHDLQADFTKNSIVMLLSDDVPDGAAVRRQHAASVTHPFVSQTHRCVAAYETKDTNNRPFKVAVDQELEVLIKDPAGWWLVEDEDKHLAWFPAPYLELWDQEGGGDDDDGDDGDDDVFPLAGALYCAVRSYSTKEEDEVSVPIGCVVEVLRKTDDGWWFISFNGKAGYIPSMHLQPYNNPRAGLYSLQRKLHGSTLNLATSRDLRPPRPASVHPRPYSAGQPGRGPSEPGPLRKARSLDILSEAQSQSITVRDDSTSDGRARCMSSTVTDTSFSNSPSSSRSRDKDPRESPTGGPAASLQPGDGGSSGPISVLSGRRGSSTSSSSDRSSTSSDRSSTSSDRSSTSSDRSSTSSYSSGSASSSGGETPSAAPRVPPRPKTEEILTRCSTMTRRAAMASRSRLQIQPESIYSR